MKLEFEIPDELLRPEEPAPAVQSPGMASGQAPALSGGPAPDTVAVTGLGPAPLGQAQSAGAAELVAGHVQSANGVAGGGMDGGAAPQG